MVYKTLVVGVIVLFIGISIIPNISGNNIKNNEDLVVTVKTNKEIYYFIEPVWITISVTNYGPDTILFFSNSELADLLITKLNGEYVYRHSWHYGHWQAVFKLPIKQSETKVLLRHLWFKLRDFPSHPSLRFPVPPGKYCITGWMVEGAYHPMIKGEPVEITFRLFRFI